MLVKPLPRCEMCRPKELRSESFVFSPLCAHGGPTFAQYQATSQNEKRIWQTRSSVSAFSGHPSAIITPGEELEANISTVQFVASERSHDFLRAAAHNLASLSHLVPLYRTHARRLLAVERYQQQIQRSVLTCTQDVGGRDRSCTSHSSPQPCSKKMMLQVEHVDVFHDTTPPCGNHFLQEYREIAPLCTQSLPWCSQPKASTSTALPKNAPCCSGTSSRTMCKIVLNKRTSKLRGASLPVLSKSSQTNHLGEMPVRVSTS